MGAEPIYTSTPIKAPRKAWPTVNTSGYRPLAGIKVLDFSRVIAAPVASKILAALGADVIKVSYTGNPEIDILLVDMSTGKRDVDINLKTDAGKETFKNLVKDADILVDGFRPGALAKLGFDSSSLRSINPSLIYMRENCYGFKGPLAYRSGWQQISDCLVGISWLQGRFLGLDEPVVPLLRK
jgi:crotonobetainyl-CoA:carnitine CoA-transferase CaiB-like acyl-CoA transferase